MKGFKFKKFFMKYLLIILLVIGIIYAFNYLTSSQKFLEPGSKELLLMHMNGCGHCERLMPEWKKFETNNNSGISTRAVEISDGQDLAKKYNVNGFPTILLLGKNGKKLDTYDGPRTADGLSSYCNKNA